MAKNIRVSDELYDYIQSVSNDGETIGNTVARLLDVEQSKGLIHTQDNHRSDLMPMEVYPYTILDAFRSMEECFHRTEYIWDGRLTAGHLQLKIENLSLKLASWIGLLVMVLLLVVGQDGKVDLLMV